jgi:Family of unknown function (DUF695)
MGVLGKLFGGKQPTEPLSSIPESWTVKEGKNQGNIMIVRKNDGCKSIAGHKDYPFRCGIAFKFNKPEENGLPSPDENPDLNVLEDSIFDTYENDLSAIVTLIITTSGFREFVLYSKTSATFNEKMKELQSLNPKYNLTTYCELDKDWSQFNTK